MADDGRLTKAERREQARAERRQKEAEAAARAKRRRITSTIIGLAIAAFVGWVLWLAFAGGPGELEGVQVIDPVAASDARAQAGCEAMPVDLSGNAVHYAPAEAPPAESLYTLRPTASGPHFESPLPPGVYRGGVDERGSTHSMEHGAIVVWFDKEKVDSSTVDDMADWAEVLNAAGFGRATTGAGIFVAAYDAPFTSGKPIALRAWGAALDCDSWEQVIGDAFVIDHYGTAGISPERSLGPFPPNTLVFSPGANETESPNGGLDVAPTDQGDSDPSHGGDDTDGGEGSEDAEADGGDADAEASEEPTPDPSPSDS